MLRVRQFNYEETSGEYKFMIENLETLETTLYYYTVEEYWDEHQPTHMYKYLTPFIYLEVK